MDISLLLSKVYSAVLKRTYKKTKDISELVK